MVASLIGNVVLVPVYLAYWNPSDCGVWLALQSAFTLVQIIDTGHSRFLWNEFMRLTSHRRRVIRRVLWSGIVTGAIIGGAQALGVWWICRGHLLHLVLGTDMHSIVSDLEAILITYALTWWVYGSIGGVLVVAVLPFGYFPTTAWWGVANTILLALAPVIAVVNGANIVLAALTQIFTGAALGVLQIMYLLWIVRKERIAPIRPCFRFAVRNFLRSQAITVQLAIELIRMQGSRLAIAPFVGTAAVAGFQYMRTGSGVVLNGLNALLGPVLPELMRYLKERDQAKVESCCALLWSLSIYVLIPSALLMQLFIRPAFQLWTQYQIPFDPLLFSTLSCSVLIYSLSVPAMAIVHGNNLLAQRLAISILASIIFVGMLMLLLPRFGLSTAGICLMLAELASLIGLTLVAAKWMSENSMGWPTQLFCNLSVATTAGCTAVVTIGYIESVFSWVMFPLMGVWIYCCSKFWKQLPFIAKSRLLDSFAGLRATRPCCDRS